mgnify:CR=1 FL=1
MATTNQAKYDAAVAKYLKAKTDATMKANNVTIKTDEKTTTTPIKATEVKIEKPTQIVWATKTAPIEVWTRVLRADWKYTAEEIAQNKRADELDKQRAVEKEARLKKEYELVSSKAGGTENLLKITKKKYWVNSPEYITIKKKADKYWTPTSTVKTNIAEKTIEPIKTSVWLTSTQYNALLKKYWDAEWVITATKNQYWTNSPEVKKIEKLLNNYTWINTPKIVRENIVITDSKLKTPDTMIKWLEVSDYKWNSVVDYLKSINQDTSFASRIKLAKDLWINNYIWTASQNADLLNKMRNRKPWETVDNSITNAKVDKWELPESERENVEQLWSKANPEPTWELWSKANPEPAEIKANEKNLEALKKYRLSWQTDEDLLKKAEDKYWKDSAEYKKVEKFVKENPLADSTTNIDETLLEKTKEELDKEQIKSLEAAKDENIAITAENFLKWSEVISANNEKLQEFYKNMATELKTFIEDNKVRKEKALQRTKDSELNRVVGQIRATLARRWVDIWNIAPEQLIAMSWELWAEAMRKIDEATSEMEESVSKLTQEKTAEINKLLETWLIKQSEADASIEQMRQLKEKMISDIKSNFTSNVFKITQASISDADKNKAEALNAISTFTSWLWISWTAQWIMEDYLDSSDSVEAIKNMIEDLNDENSRLYKAVADAQKAAELAAQFEAKIKLMNATKSSSSGSSTPSSPKYSATQVNALDNIWRANWVPELSNVRTVDQYLALLKTLPSNVADNIRNQFDKIRWWSTEQE